MANPTREEFWRIYPGEPYPYNEEVITPKSYSEEEQAFWNWIWDYDPGSAKVLGKDPSAVKESKWWDYFLKNVYAPTEPLPSSGRPIPEKYGINDTDWLVLMKLSGNSAKVQAELERWISTGYITDYQARDIWDELEKRGQEARAQLFYGEDPEARAKRLAEQERAETLRTMGPPPGVGGRAEALAGARRRRAFEEYAPTTRYMPALEEMRGEFAEEMPQTERWQDWFRSKYPRLIEQFKAQLPDFEARYYRGMGPSSAEEQIQKTWAEWIRERKPEIYEQWHKMSPYERGERPSYYAPRIATVGF